MENFDFADCITTNTNHSLNEIGDFLINTSKKMSFKFLKLKRLVTRNLYQACSHKITTNKQNSYLTESCGLKLDVYDKNQIIFL